MSSIFIHVSSSLLQELGHRWLQYPFLIQRQLVSGYTQTSNSLLRRSHKYLALIQIFKYASNCVFALGTNGTLTGPSVYTAH